MQIVTTPTAQCVEWRGALLNDLSYSDSCNINSKLNDLDESKGYVFANTWLRNSIERLKLLNKVSVLRAPIEKHADRLAEKIGHSESMQWLRSTVKRLQYMDALITDLNGRELAAWAEEKSHLFELNLTRESMNEGAKSARNYMSESLAAAGVEFDSWDDLDKVTAMAARMIQKEWWIRNAKKQFTIVEDVLRECGEVHIYASPYVSSWSLNKFRKQQQTNRAFLESREAINQYNQSYTLAELSDKSISKPLNRRNELMTRIRGTEELAVEMGCIGYFITLTCPSKYHAVKSNGKHNRKFFRFGCPTVRAGHKYLNNVWKLIRTYCSNNMLRFCGLRTVEPNHDGCPHWHMMLFCLPEHGQSICDAFMNYGLQEDGNEKGAQENRVKIVKIDPEKGTASGYVAKYISKNIDGKHIDTDLETGRSGSDAAERITAWARRHRIRQFQFFGGASVTVWREVRRFKVENAPALISDIFTAAKLPDWKEFVKLMGGMFAGRNQTLKPHYSEPEENQFGELVSSIKGVSKGAETIITRFYEWTIQKVGAGSLKDGSAVPWTRVNNCTPPSRGGNYQPIYQ